MTEKRRRKRESRSRTSQGLEIHDPAARSSKPAEPAAANVEETLAKRREAPEESPLPAIGMARREIVQSERRSHMEQENQSTVNGEGILTNTGTALKEGVVGSLKGINEVEAEALHVIEQTAAGALNVTHTVAVDGLTAIKDVAGGMVQTLTDVGTGVTGGLKTVATSMVNGVNDVGSGVLTVGHHAARGMVSGAAEIGADVGMVAMTTAQGVVGATQLIGGSVGTLARSTVENTIDAVGTVGTSAVKTIAGVLVAAVVGVKAVLGAALPHSR